MKYRIDHILHDSILYDIKPNEKEKHDRYIILTETEIENLLKSTKLSSSIRKENILHIDGKFDSSKNYYNIIEFALDDSDACVYLLRNTYTETIIERYGDINNSSFLMILFNIDKLLPDYIKTLTKPNIDISRIINMYFSPYLKLSIETAKKPK